LLELLL